MADDKMTLVQLIAELRAASASLGRKAETDGDTDTMKLAARWTGKLDTLRMTYDYLQREVLQVGEAINRQRRK